MTQLALNPFKKGKKTEVEGVRKVEADNKLINKVIESYDKIIPNKQPFKGILSDLDEVVLTPHQINYFLQHLIFNNKIKGTVWSHSDITGYCISKLIKNSYDAGNNDFVLDTRDTSITDIGHEIKGKKDNMINLVINGNLGRDSFTRAKYSNIIVNGNVGKSSAYRTKKSNIIINGNVDLNFGHWISESSVNIKGDIQKDFARESSYNCFLINKMPTINGFGYCCWESTFKTKYEDVYDTIANKVTESNKVQLIDYWKGNVIKERKND